MRVSHELDHRRRVLPLLIAVVIITFLDRMSIAVSGPRIQQELHIALSAGDG